MSLKIYDEDGEKRMEQMKLTNHQLCGWEGFGGSERGRQRVRLAERKMGPRKERAFVSLIPSSLRLPLPSPLLLFLFLFIFFCVYLFLSWYFWWLYFFIECCICYQPHSLRRFPSFSPPSSYIVIPSAFADR